jgi:hypothetical protein
LVNLTVTIDVTSLYLFAMDVFIYFEREIPGVFRRSNRKPGRKGGTGSAALTPATAPFGKYNRSPAHTHQVDPGETCEFHGVYIGAAEPLDLDVLPLLQLEPDLLNESLRIAVFADPDSRLEFLEQFILFDVSSPPDTFSDGRIQGR